jgi:transcription-repair coupling factor (superfamily II helicase)
VAMAADVDDIGAEWVDRYGPLPVPAAALLSVARLRTTMLARGIREVAMSPVRGPAGRPAVVRVLPVHLSASAQVRLARLHRGAAYKEELAQLSVPIPPGESAADVVRDLIEDLVPAPDSGAVGDNR